MAFTRDLEYVSRLWLSNYPPPRHIEQTRCTSSVIVVEIWNSQLSFLSEKYATHNQHNTGVTSFSDFSTSPTVIFSPQKRGLWEKVLDRWPTTPPPTFRTQLVVVIRPFEFKMSSNPAKMDLQSELLSYFAHYGQVCKNIHISWDFLLNGKETDTRPEERPRQYFLCSSLKLNLVFLHF